MKTLSFQKETVRALVSVELDSIVGGATVSSAEPAVSSRIHTVATSSAVSSALRPTLVSSQVPVSSVHKPQTLSSALPPDTKVSSVYKPGIWG